jgi:hypothetical protein
VGDKPSKPALLASISFLNILLLAYGVRRKDTYAAAYSVHSGTYLCSLGYPLSLESVSGVWMERMTFQSPGSESVVPEEKVGIRLVHVVFGGFLLVPIILS